MPAIAITGCSSGFGRATTWKFLAAGWHVVATVRREADRDDLIKDASARGHDGRLTVVIADITRAEDVAALRDAVARVVPSLDALVNNAGTAFPAPIELLPLDDLREQLELNVVAQVAVTQSLLPALKAARGTVVNVSSISGKVASPGIAAYSASKFALEGLSDALRIELAPFGVRVVVIEPGSSPTKIWNTSRARVEAKQIGARAGAYATLIDALTRRATEGATAGFPPELFADTVWQAVTARSPRTRYAIPPAISRFIFLRRFLTDKFLDRRIRRILGW